MSAKLFRATKDLSSGTISNAWHFIAEDMEATADTHRTIAGALADELVRPLKAFVEAQHKTRKNLEAVVDKRYNYGSVALKQLNCKLDSKLYYVKNLRK